MTQELEPPLESPITSPESKACANKTFEASTLAGNSYKFFSKTRAFEENMTKVGGGYG
jgi:hypothetical protein